MDYESTVGGVPLIPVRLFPTTKTSLSTYISEWIPARNLDENIADDALSQGTGSDKTATAGIRHPEADAQHTDAASVSPMKQTENYDSDEEIEFEHAEKCVLLGRKAAVEGNCLGAESFLRRALESPRLLARLSPPIAASDLQYELAVVLLKQEKLEEARTTCEELVKCKMQGDVDRFRVLNACQTIAQVYLLQNLLPAAATRCLQAMKGRRRLSPKSQDYFEAVALMVSIRKAQNDTVDEAVYADMLPSNFIMPVFKTALSSGPRKTSLSPSPPQNPTTREQHPSAILSSNLKKNSNDRVAGSSLVTSNGLSSLLESLRKLGTEDPIELNYMNNFLPKGSSGHTKIPCHMHEGGENGLSTVAFTPDGQLLACGTWAGTAWVSWMWKSNTVDLRLRLQAKYILCLWKTTLSLSGRLIAVASNEDGVELWCTSTGTSRMILKGHGSLGVQSVVFSPDGKLLASNSHDETFRLWDLATGKLKRTFVKTDTMYALAFSQDGEMLATGSYHEGNVRLWEIATGTTRLLRGHNPGLSSIAFSPNGKSLVSGSWDCSVLLWDVETGKSHLLVKDEDRVDCVAFSPNGELVASASSAVRLTNVTTGESRVIGKHEKGVKSVAFSPNGRLLASGSSDGTVKLWDLGS